MSTIPYDLSRIKAFVFDIDGVLSPNILPVAPDGQIERMANVKDGYALHTALKYGYKIAIITGGLNERVVKRYNLLGIEDVYTHAAEKLPILQRWMEQNNLTPDQVAYCGDDVPDLHVMHFVGLAIAPADAGADAKEAANYISPYCGGCGVARDLIEQTMRAQGTWLSDSRAFIW